MCSEARLHWHFLGRECLLSLYLSLHSKERTHISLVPDGKDSSLTRRKGTAHGRILSTQHWTIDPSRCHTYC